jgi:hypothetical protein
MQNISLVRPQPFETALLSVVSAFANPLKHEQPAFTIFILMVQHHPTNKANHLFQGWKLLLSTNLVLAMLLALPSSAASRKIQNQNKALPVFDINKTEHNFGDRFIGEELVVRFTVRNLGAAPLLLSETPILVTPTIGLSLESWQSDPRSLKDLAKPAGLGKGALPYT